LDERPGLVNTMSNEEVVAIHEAGHAVAYCRLFPQIEPSKPKWLRWLWKPAIVTIEGSGAVMYVPLTPPNMYEEYAVYACAGFAAEALAGSSDPERGAQTDFRMAMNRSRRPLDEIKREALTLLSRTENMLAVADVARELMKRRTLSLTTVREIVVERTDER
jgi:hypothetical protein